MFHTSPSLAMKLDNPNKKEWDLKRKISYLVLKKLECLQYKLSAQLHCNSESLRQMMRKEFKIKKPICVTYLPIEDELKKKRLERKVNGEYLLVYGRIEERKGFEFLGKVIPKIVERYPKIKIVIIGNKAINSSIPLDKIKHLKNVKIMKKMPRSKVLSFVKYAKAVILASPWEAFGYTCLESLALGIIVLATKGSGFEEIIRSENNGFLFEPNNEKEFFSKLEKIMSLKELEREQMKKNAQKRAEFFSKEKIIKIKTKCYEKMKR